MHSCLQGHPVTLITVTFTFPADRTTHTGEVRIINNGTLVARIYGDVRTALTIEVLVPLVSL